MLFYNLRIVATRTTHPRLTAERLVPILLTALQEASSWWYHDGEGPRLAGDAFKVRARQVRARVEQARELGERYLRERGSTTAR